MTEPRSEDAGPLAPRRTLGRVQEPPNDATPPAFAGAPGTAADTARVAPTGPSTGGAPKAPHAAPTLEQPVPAEVGQRPTDRSEPTPAPTAPRRPDRPPSTPPPSSPQQSDRQRAGSSPRPKSKGTRRATLRLSRIDPWSVMKTALLLSIAFGIAVVVAVAVVWSVLDAANVWDSVNRSIADVVGGESGGNFNVQNYIGMQRVLGFTSLVAVIDVVLLTAIATLSAFLYNLAASLLGGLEVTLAEH